jgi:glucose-6-phosphate 1-dehydrogenase
MAKTSADPCLFVVLGGRSDLMRRKLLPALYHLVAQHLLKQNWVILGAGRKGDVDDAGFRAWARDALLAAGLFTDREAARWCDHCLYYQSVGRGGPEDFRALASRIVGLEQTHLLPGNRVFYLALPPAALPETIRGLGEAGLNQSHGWNRVVIEKPFGRDLATAEELDRLVHRYFDESQVYRIDHYLGKETVQNLLAFRFANAIFEAIWNRDRIESVEITVAESLGVEQRAGYYDNSGVVRDMVQNHLTQLLCIMAMELPTPFGAAAIRQEKVKILCAIHPLSPEQAIFGQYGRSQVGGQEVPGYLEEPGVPADSRTPTYVALRGEIANCRWQGVPFYLRTGKRLARRVSEIVVNFRCPPVFIFQAYDSGGIHCNRLVIALQPDEGFDLHFEVKAPGPQMRLQTQRLHFRYAEAFEPLHDAYETLLLDVMNGDQTLFVGDDWVEASWQLYAPLLTPPATLHSYPAGSWGPAEANRVFAGNGRPWGTT